MNMERRSYQFPIVALATQTISSDTTTVGVALNLETYKKYKSITFMTIAGVVTTGDATLLIEDSADGITYAAVADLFLVGLEADTKVDVTSEVKTIGYVGNKKYVRASLVSANTASLIATVLAIFENPVEIPVV